ncbi:MAG: HesA/MoeB/ThiF family protein [Nanoarchaeota archaeon]
MDDRYSRQILLPEIGLTGQETLQQKKVVIVGIGALGTAAAELLARTGVGNLCLIDRDVVELNNLHRQILFEESDVGKSKAVAAKEKLTRINSSIRITAEPIHLNLENISLLTKADLILDCTDNLETRFLINDFCKKENLPWIYAAAIKTSGYAMPILAGQPCLRCFLQEASLDTCDTVGVLNTITCSIAALQATLALKILLGKKIEPYLYYYNLWNQEFKKIKINKKEDCETCNGNYLFLENKKGNLKKAIRFCSAGKYQLFGPKPSFKELKKKWEKLGQVIDDGVTLQFREISLFKDGRALIKAQTEEEAQAIYSRWIGN